jgi:hypothetical protein
MTFCAAEAARPPSNPAPVASRGRGSSSRSGLHHPRAPRRSVRIPGQRVGVALGEAAITASLPPRSAPRCEPLPGPESRLGRAPARGHPRQVRVAVRRAREVEDAPGGGGRRVPGRDLAGSVARDPADRWEETRVMMSDGSPVAGPRWPLARALQEMREQPRRPRVGGRGRPPDRHALDVRRPPARRDPRRRSRPPRGR